MFIISYRWIGSGVNEKGVDKATKVDRVTVNPKYYRPTEVDLLLGNPSKAKKILGWEPKKTFEVKYCTLRTYRNGLLITSYRRLLKKWSNQILPYCLRIQLHSIISYILDQCIYQYFYYSILAN